MSESDGDYGFTQEELCGINWWPGDGTDKKDAPRKYREFSDIAEDIKIAAAGQWSGILGLDLELMCRKGRACPRCAYTPRPDSDRFHAFKDSVSTGATSCRRCQKTCSNGIDAYAWLNGIEWVDAVKELADQLGVKRTLDENAPKPKPPSVIETVARNKRMPLESFKKYGVKEDVRNGNRVARVDVYNENGELFSHFDISTNPNDKGLNKKGGGNAGLFLPGKVPAAGETWYVVEGVKDAAALDSLGYQTVGLPTSTMNAKYAPMFKGVHVICVPDLDGAGMNGAVQTARLLFRKAKSIKIARLDGKVADKDGDGVREVLARQGADSVHKSISDAEAWTPAEQKNSKQDADRERRNNLIAELQTIIADWDILCVHGKHKTYRFSGEFFKESGVPFELEADEVRSFAKFQTALIREAQNGLPPHLAEVWEGVAVDFVRTCPKIESDQESDQRRQAAAKLWSYAINHSVNLDNFAENQNMYDRSYFGTLVYYHQKLRQWWIMVDFLKLAETLNREIPKFESSSLRDCLRVCGADKKRVHIREHRFNKRYHRLTRDNMIQVGMFAQIGKELQIINTVAATWDLIADANRNSTFGVVGMDNPDAELEGEEYSDEDIAFPISGSEAV